jgi:hypothetical protein
MGVAVICPGQGFSVLVGMSVPPKQTIKNRFNPLPLLFKDLLHGQKDRIFFQRAFKCIGHQQRWRVFRPARDI